MRGRGRDCDDPNCSCTEGGGTCAACASATPTSAYSWSAQATGLATNSTETMEDLCERLVGLFCGIYADHACDADGRPLDDLIVLRANQEHGIVGLRPGSRRPAPKLPVGTRLCILPNHACATAAQFAGYSVLPADGGPIREWARFGGW